MKIIFLGIGEAFDENIPTSCFLIKSKTNLLLDCGYSSPPALWRYNRDPNLLDSIFVSHTHMDHSFGLAPIIMDMRGRKNPLTIICQKGNKDLLQNLLNIGLKGIKKYLDYQIKYLEVNPNQKIILDEYQMAFAKTLHAGSNLAIRIKTRSKDLSYSGDGFITKESEALFSNTKFLIHDGYKFDGASGNHCNMKQVIDMCQRCNIKKIAFTHLERNEKKKIPLIKKQTKKLGLQIIFPKPGDEIIL
jgi:ribonuclease BN (tRNA processing enzyme)